MSALIRFAPASLTADQYDESVRWLTDAGDFPPDGLDYHVCFGSSREQLEAFGQRLMPVLAEIGIDPGEPERLGDPQHRQTLGARRPSARLREPASLRHGEQPGVSLSRERSTLISSCAERKGS